MAGEQDFWNFAYALQQQGALCDMQLCIANPPVVFPAHRLVLLASSAYYQASLLEGDFQDTYYFDGIKEENLKLLLAYCYRQASWSELTKSAEAAVAAQTLQLVQHSDPVLVGTDAELSQKMQKEDKYPEMVLVQVGSPGEEIKQELESGTKNSVNVSDVVPKEDKCAKTENGKRKNERQSTWSQLGDMDEADKTPERAILKSKNQESLFSEKKRKICVSPRKRGTSSNIIAREKGLTSAKISVKDQPSISTEEVLSKSSTRKNLKKSKVSTDMLTAAPERSSTRIRKATSKYADYEDVPTFSPKRQKIEDAGSPRKGKKRRNGSDEDKREKILSSDENSGKGDDCESICDKPQTNSSESKEAVQLETKTVEMNNYTYVVHGDSNAYSETKGLHREDRKDETEEISIMITLEPPQDEINGDKRQEKSVIEVSGKDASDDQVHPRIDEKLDESGQKRRHVKREGKELWALSIICEVCGGSFTTLSTCIAHERREHKHYRVLSCPDCSKTFKEKRQLVRHVNDVHNKNSYDCDVCQAQFKSKEGLALHRKKKHSTSSGTLQCDECEKMFHVTSELKSHKLFKHSSERNEACDSCQRTFKTKSLLKRHKNTYHSAERKHMCDICGSMFKTVNDMKMHRKKHYKKDGTFVEEIIPRAKLMYPPGDYPCRFCGKVFSKHHVRATHERTLHIEKLQGNLFICTICNKSFPIKQSLMNHIKNKHLPRRYQCSTCQQKFVTQKELIRHIENPERCKGEIRETRKPFWCADCQIGFTLKGNLTKHIQKGLCLRNKKVTTNYVVVLQKTGESGEGNTPTNKRLEKIIALDEEWDKVQDIVEEYKENSMLEVELLNEQSVENLEEQMVGNVEEIMDQEVVQSVGDLVDGEEIILQQQEDGTMIIPYSSSDGQTTIQTLNLSELQQAALAGGGNLEILMPEGTNIGDIATAMGGNIEIHVEESDAVQSTVVLADGEVIQDEGGVISDSILLQTDCSETPQQSNEQDSYSLECNETDIETVEVEESS